MVKEIMQTTFLNNRVVDYIVSLAILVIGILSVRVVKSIVIARLKKWAEKTKTNIDDFLITIIEKTIVPLLYFGAFYIATRGLYLHPTVSKVIDVLGVILLTFMAARFTAATLEFLLKDYWLKKSPDETKERNIRAILPAIKVIIFGLALVFLLDNLGFKISTVIAGLGIGGVAVALASQAVLGDMFNYFTILFDRPFEVGDFIIIDNYLGTVEYIGIKTTRIRSLSGEQLVFSNTDLTNSRIRNYKRMAKRRVVFKIGVTYETKCEQLREIPSIIKSIIEGIEDTAFDRAHFSSFGDFSLIFEVVYYVLSRDYNKYMDTQQAINLAIKEEFEKRGIEFAYPTQMIYTCEVK
ncbi:mechanosensitive ion channel family protein [Candidatus Sumerlaeota bacterium]|nr:mechanosensitive ion channel family protein [Candidatus Sumerlaeota bacterium]